MRLSNVNKFKTTYRNAAPQDIIHIMKIEQSAFPSLICEKKSVFAERIKIFPEGFRIIEIEGSAAGYICSELWTMPEKITHNLFTLGHSIKKQHNPKGKELYISSMGIISEHQGKGLGKALFEEFLSYITKEFKCIDSMILIVSEKWINARRIYSSNNFKEICVLENFFAYGCNEPYYENGIVMRKKLLQNY